MGECNHNAPLDKRTMVMRVVKGIVNMRTVSPSLPVLRHRIKTNFNADAEGVAADEIIERLIDTTAVIADDEKTNIRVPDVFRSADAG